jgi:hypothetical protein
MFGLDEPEPWVGDGKITTSWLPVKRDTTSTQHSGDLEFQSRSRVILFIT